MNVDSATIDDQFSIMVKKYNISPMLGITASYMRMLRYKVNNKITIRQETKIKLLQRYGIRLQGFQFTRADMVDAINFYIKSSEASKIIGVEYVLEKFIKAREKKHIKKKRTAK